MLVGWGGNNGTTFTACHLANKLNLSWKTRIGEQKANYFGSLVNASTVNIGLDSQTGQDVWIGFNQLLPMVHPNDLVVGGWDISSMNLGDAMDRAAVLEPDLKRQVYETMKNYKPLPSIYSPDFIAKNQGTRADNLIQGSKSEQLAQIRKDILNFKQSNSLDKVIVLWTANTERYSAIDPAVNGSCSETLLKAIEKNENEISPSTIFAVASILENCPFINGSPQNTFVPGVIDLAEKKGVFIAGDDFKSGQTKLKSVLTDFLISSGIKPLGITSYNHLGNNDGLNLSQQEQFVSKEISKSSVISDMVASNPILFPPSQLQLSSSKNTNSNSGNGSSNEEVNGPDHVVVIKYVPSVGDSKRALDEYESEIFCGGRNTISIHNVCEDSLLAVPLIFDLVILTELFTRVQLAKVNGNGNDQDVVVFRELNVVLGGMLGFLLKAPVVPAGQPVVNSLFKQRNALENFLRALIGLPPQNELNLNRLL